MDRVLQREKQILETLVFRIGKNRKQPGDTKDNVQTTFWVRNAAGITMGRLAEDVLAMHKDTLTLAVALEQKAMG